VRNLRCRKTVIDKTRPNAEGTAHAVLRGMEEQLDPLTRRVIGCAIIVHRYLGPGLLESIYRSALAIEMELDDLSFERERTIDVFYRGKRLGEFRPDLSCRARSSSK
jgi:hypothetical protein